MSEFWHRKIWKAQIYKPVNCEDEEEKQKLQFSVALKVFAFIKTFIFFLRTRLDSLSVRQMKKGKIRLHSCNRSR